MKQKTKKEKEIEQNKMEKHEKDIISQKSSHNISLTPSLWNKYKLLKEIKFI